MRQIIASGTALIVLGGAAALAFAAADWGVAEHKAEEFQRKHEQLRKLTPEMTQKLVNAICEAEEAERELVAQDAARRVKDKLDDEHEDLADLKSQALRGLDAVLSDGTLKARHSKARDYKRNIAAWWGNIDELTRSARGANHPAVAFMLEEGQEAHEEYQQSASKCDVYGFQLDSGRAECIQASTCTVIELKPDNARAITRGRGQAEKYARELNDNPATRQRLIEKNSKFQSCERFDYQVDCYSLCPAIDPATNEMRPTSVRWDSDC